MARPARELGDLTLGPLGGPRPSPPLIRQRGGASLSQTHRAATAGIALRMACSGASHSFNMLREQVVDEGLVAQPSPLGLPSHGVEHLRIDPNGDQPPGLSPQEGPPHASHPSKLGGRSFRDVGEVNPGPPPRRPPALSGPPRARSCPGSFPHPLPSSPYTPPRTPAHS